MDMRVHQRCLRHSQPRQRILQTGRPALPTRHVHRRGRCWTTAVVFARAKAATVAQPQQSAPAAAVQAAPLPAAVTYAVTASTVYAGVLLLAMILFPRLQAVRKAMQSYWWSLPLALVYLALLVYSWTPDHISTLLPGSLTEGLTGGFNPQFFPRLDAISELFSQPATAASLLLHILAINLFLGRSIYLDGLAKGIPTAHSLIVAATLGPLGLITHWITKVVFFNTPGLRPDRKQQVLKDGNGGSIIIMPYEL